MNKVIFYHGSAEIAQKPVLEKGKSYNDYGKGFYCTRYMELAKEWACTEGTDGYVNEYEIDTDDLNICDLSGSEYTVLHWLALLMEHRKVDLRTPIMEKGAAWLRKNYLIDISEYDMIIGYRADDSYFSFVRSFLSNEISLKQLNYAMALGELGKQYVLKSQKAFQHLCFVSFYPVDESIYYAKRMKRDQEARLAFRKVILQDDIDCLYMRDMIKEEVLPNDPRLR